MEYKEDFTVVDNLLIPNNKLTDVVDITINPIISNSSMQLFVDNFRFLYMFRLTIKMYFGDSCVDDNIEVIEHEYKYKFKFHLDFKANSKYDTHYGIYLEKINELGWNVNSNMKYLNL